MCLCVCVCAGTDPALPSLCPLHRNICRPRVGLGRGGVTDGRGGRVCGEERKAEVSIHVMAPFIGGRWIYLSHFFILSLLTFQVRLQGAVGETPSRDPRCQMVFRQWLSTRTGAQEEAATSLRNAENDVLRQLLDAFRWLHLLPGAGGGGGCSGGRQRLRRLRCPGPGVPPPAGVPVNDPSGCGFLPAVRLLSTVAGW